MTVSEPRVAMDGGRHETAIQLGERFFEVGEKAHRCNLKCFFLMQVLWCRRYHAVMADLAVDGARSAQPYFTLRTGDPPDSTFQTRLVLTSEDESTHILATDVFGFFPGMFPSFSHLSYHDTTNGERMNGNRYWDCPQLDETWGRVNMARI